MGRAARWLRSLLTGKKNAKDPRGNSTHDADADAAAAAGGGKREKRRWSFGKPGKAPDDEAAVATAGKDSAWLRSFCAESEEERSRRSMAVAAAADAAVAVAQAVVRLTSHGRGTMFGGGARERWAAVRIQTVFRRYLARKALRALKALVKLQARVRGCLVRRQAAMALRGMQALVRAQATARTQRITGSLRPRRSLERLDETRSKYPASFHSGRLSSCMDHVGGFDGSPKIVEVDPGRPRPRNRRPAAAAWLDSAGDTPPHSPPLPRQLPTWISTPDPRGKSRDLDWSLTGDECRFSTAQSTPRIMNSGGPPTPAKRLSGGGGDFTRRPQSPCHHQHPNYMTKTTQSFEAKVRSQSTPKQRPEPAGARKRLSPNGVAEARASLSGARMRCSLVQEAFGFGNAGVGGGVDHSAELGRRVGRDYSFHGMRW